MLVAGSLSAIFLAPKFHQQQHARILSFSESTMFAAFLIPDGITACTLGVFICVGQAFRTDRKPKMSLDYHPAIVFTANHGIKMQQPTLFVNKSPADWIFTDADGRPSTKPI